MTTGIAPGFAPKETDSLQTRIGWYTMNGYVVESQTETSAQLVAPKGKFSWGWFIFWWFLPPLPIFAYPIYHYFIKRKRVVELYVAEGKVERR